MLIFKQKILKVELVKTILTNMLMFSIVALMSIWGIIEEGFTLVALVPCIIFFIPFLCNVLVSLSYLEWFEIYDDRIVVKNVYRTKNVVLFSNVQEIREVTITLTQNDMPKQFYILDDGRKDHQHWWSGYRFYDNRKKYNLQIYKTPELEEFLRKRFDIEINREKETTRVYFRFLNR